jgi:transcriptional regulator with XRE-family HTH domain
MSSRIVPDSYLAAFGSHVRSLRKKAGLSQEDVAGMAGIHVTYLSGIERGLRNPTILNLRRLAHALAVLTKELLSFEENLTKDSN